MYIKYSIILGLIKLSVDIICMFIIGQGWIYICLCVSYIYKKIHANRVRSISYFEYIRFTGGPLAMPENLTENILCPIFLGFRLTSSDFVLENTEKSQLNRSDHKNTMALTPFTGAGFGLADPFADPWVDPWAVTPFAER